MTRSVKKITPKRTPSFLQNEVPPIVHALGGSIGSALALLLFYPLERARIEMQSRAAGSAVKKTELSPIRSADDSQLLSDNCNNLVIEDENSWDRAADSPTSTSWSMNSCSTDDDGNTVGSIHEQDSYGDNDYDSNTEGIVQCLLDLRQRGVLYQGVKPIISTIFTRYVRSHTA